MEREIGNKRERMARIDRQGREHGENLGAEIVVGLGALLGGEFDIISDVDTFIFEGRAESLRPEADDFAGELRAVFPGRP